MTDHREYAPRSERGGVPGPDGPIVAVCCEGASVLALFDLATGDLLGSVPVGAHPVHATVADGRVFVATMGERSIDVVDTDGSVRRVEIGVLGPSHFAVADGHLFVPCTASDVVAVIDPVGLELEGRIAVGAEPHEIAVHDGLAYVGSRADGVVSVVDTGARETVGEVEIGPDARVQGVDIHPERGRGFAVDQRGARIVAFELGSDPVPTGEAVVGADPYDLDICDDRVYVPGRGDGTVHEFGVDLGAPVVHEGFETPVQVVRYGGSSWVLDRGAARIVSLEGELFETPAPAIGGLATDSGMVLSHYDDATVSLVDPPAGISWQREAPDHPFGAVVV